MADEEVLNAYTARAVEYTSLLGSIKDMDDLAYYWSIDRMSRLLQDAGFEVLDIETRHDPGSRPHAAIAAIRRAHKIDPLGPTGLKAGC